MNKFASYLLATVVFAGPVCAIVYADGGQLRAMERVGNLQLAVFTSPNPLRAGLVDVSVLVQDADTGRAISGDAAAVAIELTPHDATQFPIRVAATSAEATNKLLRAALVDLPAPGRWYVRVECLTATGSPPGVVAFTMDAAPALPPWLSVWPWFAWPILAVMLFAVHRGLVARRKLRLPSVTR